MENKIESKIQNLIAQMTLEEKISFCSGHDTWHAESLARLGIPEITHAQNATLQADAS